MKNLLADYTQRYLAHFAPEYLSLRLLFRNVKVQIERKIILLTAVFMFM